jgi:hypothetical protein
MSHVTVVIVDCSSSFYSPDDGRRRLDFPALLQPIDTQIWPQGKGNMR